MEGKHCLNCNHNLTKTQNFCSNCGQVTSTHRFTIASFFHEGFHAVTHADKGLFYLLKELTIRPGVVAREFIQGKRKKYFNPFTFFLLLMALFVFVNNFMNPDKDEKRTIPVGITKIKHPVVKQDQLTKYHRAMKARDFMKKNGNITAMFAIPFFAFFFWLIYYRKPYNYAEHLVANLMFITFANLAFTLVVFPLQGILKGTPWIPFIPLLGFMLQAFYYAVAYKGFLQLKGFWSVFKVALSSIISIVLWVILSTSAMAIYVMRNVHFYEYFTQMGRQ